MILYFIFKKKIECLFFFIFFIFTYNSLCAESLDVAIETRYLKRLSEHISLIKINEHKFCSNLCPAFKEEEFARTSKKYFSSEKIHNAFCSFLTGDLIPLCSIIDWLSRLVTQGKLDQSTTSFITELRESALCVCMLYKMFILSCDCKKQDAYDDRLSIFESIYFFMQFSKLPVNELFDILDLFYKEFALIINPYLTSTDKPFYHPDQVKQLIENQPWIVPASFCGVYLLWKKWQSIHYDKRAIIS